jgi:hypothetical protein
LTVIEVEGVEDAPDLASDPEDSGLDLVGDIGIALEVLGKGVVTGLRTPRAAARSPFSATSTFPWRFSATASSSAPSARPPRP